MALRGYLPPDGTQNIHQTPYRYREAQGAHKLGLSIIESPECVILTADERAHSEAEHYGLARVPDDVAESALEAYRGGDIESVEAAIDGAESVVEESGGEDTDDDGIPDDLEGLDYDELQEHAKANDVPANQSADDLRDELESERDG